MVAACPAWTRIMLLPAVATALVTPSSIVRVTDAVSGRPVLLVGTMHYNPHSVAIVHGAVNAASRQHGLHATALELCDERWSTNAAIRWQDKRMTEIPTYQKLLSEDEFQVAFESSLACGLPDVVLADQAIRLTGQRLAIALRRTAIDMLTPAGWARVAADLRIAKSSVMGLTRAALNRRLLAGVPLALARYLYQSPAALPLAAFSVAALVLAAAVDEATGAVPAWEDGVVTALTAVALGRAAFVSLIRERDLCLAANIRAACLSSCERPGEEEASEARAVVAVLGMAHLAGVRDALLATEEQEEQEAFM